MRAQVLEPAGAATGDRRVPAVRLVDLDHDPTLPDGLRYPVWLKPVKSASSALAYRVENLQQLRQAAAAIRDGVGRMGSPFEFVLAQLRLPPELSGIGGRACLAEEAAVGAQVTVEGYSFQGDVHVYGIVDSITCPDSSSFLRYQYPSSLPPAVLDRWPSSLGGSSDRSASTASPSTSSTSGTPSGTRSLCSR